MLVSIPNHSLLITSYSFYRFRKYEVGSSFEVELEDDEAFQVVFSALGSTMSTKKTTVTVDAFNPHWYLQGQVGGQYTLGEIPFGELLSPNAQLGIGYNFSPVFGVRMGINAWQSKGGWREPNYKWAWNYVNPNVCQTCYS